MSLDAVFEFVRLLVGGRTVRISCACYRTDTRRWNDGADRYPFREPPYNSTTLPLSKQKRDWTISRATHLQFC
jgi:hypothetical protein